MTLLSLPLQGAIGARLRAAAAVTDLLANGAAGVLDDVATHPRQQPPFPYLVYGEASAVEAGTSDSDAQEETVTLHAWSQAAGQKEAKQILAAAYGALHDQALTLASGHLVNLRFTDMQTFRDPDGETWHGVIRFRAYVEEED